MKKIIFHLIHISRNRHIYLWNSLWQQVLEFLASLHPTHPFPADVQMIIAMTACHALCFGWHCWMLKGCLVHLIFLLQKPAGTCAAIVLLLSLSSSLTEPVTPGKAFPSSLVQQPQITQQWRLVGFLSALMVFSPHFVFGQGSSQSFLLRNKWPTSLHTTAFPLSLALLLQNFSFPAFAFSGLCIHSVWACGMMILSPPDFSSPSSCSLLPQKFPQNYSPHWRMLSSSPSPGEKCGVQSLATQPRI